MFFYLIILFLIIQGHTTHTCEQLYETIRFLRSFYAVEAVVSVHFRLPGVQQIFKMDFRVFVLLALCLTGLECSRILVLYPTISKSHIIPLQTLTVALAEKGHDITFVSTYPLGKQVKNHRDIKIPFDEADKDFLNEIAKDPKGKGLMYMLPKLASLIYRLGNDTLQMKEMKKLMAEEKFDLVIVGYFLTEFMLGVADHFKCPSILFSPGPTFTVISQSLGNPLATAGTPHIMIPVKKMDFIARLKTFLATGAELIVKQYLSYRARQIYE